MNPMANVANEASVPASSEDLGEELGREDHGRSGPVNEEVVPLDRRANGARDRDAPGLGRIVGHRGRTCSNRPCGAGLFCNDSRLTLSTFAVTYRGFRLQAEIQVLPADSRRPQRDS